MKTVDFSETIAACDLKVGRCGQLIEFMKVCEYSRSRSHYYKAIHYSDIKLKAFCSKKNPSVICNQVLCS